MNIYTENSDAVLHETSVDFVLRPCPKEIHVVQYDQSLPVVKVKLFSNGKPYVLPANALVNIRVGKNDRTFVFQPVLGCSEDRTIVYFDVTYQMTSIPGKIGPVLEVLLSNDIPVGTQITVWNSTTKYHIDNVVYFRNKYYKCLTENVIGVKPSEATSDWRELSVRLANSSAIPFVIDRNPLQDYYPESNVERPITLIGNTSNQESTPVQEITVADLGNAIIHKTSIDFTLRPCSSEIHLVQYDNSLPVVEVKLYVDGEPYIIPENAAINIRVGKNDGTFVYEPVLGCNEARDTVYFKISYQMSVRQGRIGPVLEIIVKEGTETKVANSSQIPFVIDKNPIQDSDVESQIDFPILYELQAEVADHEERIQNLEEGGSAIEIVDLTSL